MVDFRVKFTPFDQLSQRSGQLGASPEDQHLRFFQLDLLHECHLNKI